MISAAFLVIGFLALFVLWRYRPAAFVAGFFVLFSLAYRMIDITYLDVFGPVYAIELNRHVGGNGAAPMLIIAAQTFIIPLGLLLRSRALTGSRTGPLPSDNPYLVGIQRAALAGASAFLLLVYLDMIRLGTVPLFTGMDRLAYDQVSGFLHRPLYEMNFLFSSMLGIFTVLPRLQGKNFSIPFIGLLLGLLIYWALTGNRFSAFYVTLGFYAIPFAAVVAMHKTGLLVQQGRDAWSAFLSAKVIIPAAGSTAAFAVVALLMNSYYEVRNYADPLFHISQRLFVQPVQLWASVWDDTSASDKADWVLFDRIILNPTSSDANTSIQYLMEKELGYFRTQELLALGQQYAGGYPEMFFEMFGLGLALPLMVVFGFAAAFLLRLAVSNLCAGHPITALMALYVFYGFGVGYIGGMLNFLFATTYFIKIGLLVIAALFERAFVQSGANYGRSHGSANYLPDYRYAGLASNDVSRSKP